ncbi:MAG: smalltalk protein [Bacteroidaceae bacterium]|nr:smalltalk protein [Bacteroidaceae bacterium]
MKETTKKTLKRIGEIIITILTALLTTLGAHAAGIVQ